MSKERVIVKWSKKEQDWQSKYPEWPNRNARIVGNAFLTMIIHYQQFMQTPNFDGTESPFKNFRQYLNDAGFDPDTFTISVKAKQK